MCQEWKKTDRKLHVLLFFFLRYHLSIIIGLTTVLCVIAPSHAGRLLFTSSNITITSSTITVSNNDAVLRRRGLEADITSTTPKI